MKRNSNFEEENKCEEVFIAEYEKNKNENGILKDCLAKIYIETFRVNQYGSLTNLQNKIKTILADCESKLIS